MYVFSRISSICPVIAVLLLIPGQSPFMDGPPPFGGPPPPRPGRMRMQGEALLVQVPTPTLQVLLKLSDTQRQQIEQIVDKAREERQSRRGMPPPPGFGEPGPGPEFPPPPDGFGPPPGGPGGRMREAEKRASAQIENLLTEEQKKTLPTLLKALRTVRDADIPLATLAKIGLTPRQIERLATTTGADSARTTLRETLTPPQLEQLAPYLAPRPLPGRGETNDPTERRNTLPSTDSAGKTAPKTAFDANVQVIVTEDDYIVKSDGIPNHPTGVFPNARNPNRIQKQDYTFYIPRHPRVAARPTRLPMGPIGVAINGIPFYNPFNAEGLDAVTGLYTEVFDSCCGHPDQLGRYHYHKYPVCLNTPFHDTPGQHSPLIGYAFDGYPIYGPLGEDGKIPTDLDSCNGHTDPVRGYHYHVSANFPYILGGYHGVVDTRNFDRPGLHHPQPNNGRFPMQQSPRAE